ncbi:MAG: bifunctional isocitrate dehydrogenase kinase/phosphatase [Myxococcales bacterium]|nr:bifunctional isocitrate dehydrogenase kinase/phosphatase [Myxococcales bacterium]MCB9718749.1 bifunctional isocitrate dehydrogenase kinase/phosphatase [Myxococcales bacterium]
MLTLRISTVPADELAALIHGGFDSFYAEFMRLTRGARRHFDAGDWLRLQEDQRARIDLYQRYVGRTLAALEPITRRHPRDLALWTQAHVVYASLVASRPDVEVAETFFNAITRKLFHTVGVKPEIEFLDDDLRRHARQPPSRVIKQLPWTGDLAASLRELLSYPRPAIRWRDLEGDVAWLLGRVAAGCPLLRDGGGPPERFEAIKTLFFRPKEGYVVGRVVRGAQVTPLVIPVRSTSEGMVVDGALLTEAEVMPVFSSTRSYLFVDVRKPSELVDFLGSLLPQLSRSELYIAIAHHRHGKSLIYRELVDHLRHSDDPLVIAPGIRGLVMTVFTLPSYRNVFKLIRDRPAKAGMTREHVQQSYRDVFRGQRVGRLADTQEFEFLTFERARFDPECLEELCAKAPSLVRVEGDTVVIEHLYIEEKMTPLDIHLAQAELFDAQRALVDYGTAIKELAAHNIFAGDLLWKNFGVNRFGRLVLYDYDEIRPLLDCNFRRVPPPRSWEDEMSAQPYYPVHDHDVFPEEWAPFVVPRRPPALRDAFLDAHADLFTPELWQSIQQDVVAGRVRVNLPYRPRELPRR